jgi:hypothetical protein
MFIAAHGIAAASSTWYRKRALSDCWERTKQFPTKSVDNFVNYLRQKPLSAGGTRRFLSLRNKAATIHPLKINELY